MPLYEYKCTKCHKKTEKIESVRGPHLKKCPECRGKVERLQAAPAIQFKGAGWYVTDYAAKKSPGGEGASGEKSPATEGSKESALKESPSKESSKESSKEPSREVSRESKDKKTSKK